MCRLDALCTASEDSDSPHTSASFVTRTEKSVVRHSHTTALYEKHLTLAGMCPTHATPPRATIEASNLEREREREWRNETETMSTPRARPNREIIYLFFGNHTFRLIDAFDLYVQTNRDLVPIKLSLLNRRDRRYAFRLRPTRPWFVCSRSLSSTHRDTTLHYSTTPQSIPYLYHT